MERRPASVQQAFSLPASPSKFAKTPSSSRQISQNFLLSSPTPTFHPKTNNPSPVSKVSPDEVTQRLINAGKQYRQRKEERRLAQERQEREKLSAYNTPKKIGSAASTQSVSSAQTSPPDLSRLYGAYAERNKRIENLRRERHAEKETFTHMPMTNSKSEKLLSKTNYLSKRVDSRLFANANQMQQKKQRVSERQESQSRENARPVVTRAANRLNRGSVPVSDRLYNFRHTYALNKEAIQDACAPKHSHKPVINNCSKHVQPRYTQPRSRSASGRDQPTFSPVLSPQSLKIASRMESSMDRLTRSTRRSPVLQSGSPKEYTFSPSINQSSRNLNSSRNSNSTRSRVDDLYALGLANRISREFAQLNHQATEDLDECTFSPHLIAKTTPKSRTRPTTPEKVVNRLYQWNEVRNAKTQKVRNKEQYKDLDECTFAPALRAKASPETDKAVPRLQKGVSEFLQRQRKARTEKQEKSEQLNKFTGATWSNTTTTPQSFKLSAPRRFQPLHSQKRIHDRDRELASSPHSLSSDSDEGPTNFQSAIAELHRALHD